MDSVLHLNYSDLAGGAAVAANRLHRGLNRRGIKSSMLVLQKQEADDDFHLPSWPVDIRTRIRRKLIRSKLNRTRERDLGSPEPTCELFSDDRTQFGSSLLLQIPEHTKVINLHWVAGFVDYRAFLPLAAKKWPLVWTFHDLNPLRGGTHYVEPAIPECRIGEDPPNEIYPLSKAILTRKLEAYRRIPHQRLTLVAPSRWMLGEMHNCPALEPFAKHHIPYGIDSDQFKPLDRATARSVFGIAQSAPCILACADSLSVRRKGIKELIDALKITASQALGKAQITVALIGANPDSFAVFQDGGIRIVPLGKISSPGIMALAYAACDLFVIPSLQDNLPNVVLEAMACARPVLGFSAGGIPDMVEDGVTGRLVPTGDSAKLATALSRMLSDQQTLEGMGLAGRETILKSFSLEKQASAYERLYAEAISRTP